MFRFVPKHIVPKTVAFEDEKNIEQSKDIFARKQENYPPKLAEISFCNKKASGKKLTNIMTKYFTIQKTNYPKVLANLGLDILINIFF